VRRLAALIPVLAAAGLLLGACGGGGSSPKPTDQEVAAQACGVQPSQMVRVDNGEFRGQTMWALAGVEQDRRVIVVGGTSGRVALPQSDPAWVDPKPQTCWPLCYVDYAKPNPRSNPTECKY
jgi:hypothetical protein